MQVKIGQYWEAADSILDFVDWSKTLIFRIDEIKDGYAYGVLVKWDFNYPDYKVGDKYNWNAENLLIHKYWRIYKKSKCMLCNNYWEYVH